MRGVFRWFPRWQAWLVWLGLPRQRRVHQERESAAGGTTSMSINPSHLGAVQAVGYSNVEARFPAVALHSRWFAPPQFLAFGAAQRGFRTDHFVDKPGIHGHNCCCQKAEFVANPANGNCQSTENSEGKGRSALHPPTSRGTQLQLHPLPEANPTEAGATPRVP